MVRDAMGGEYITPYSRLPSTLTAAFTLLCLFLTSLRTEMLWLALYHLWPQFFFPWGSFPFLSLSTFFFFFQQRISPLHCLSSAKIYWNFFSLKGVFNCCEIWFFFGNPQGFCFFMEKVLRMAKGQVTD